MGFLKGLAAVQTELEKRPVFEDRVKAPYVNVEDGKSVKITPLQELDEGSPNFSRKNGVGIFVVTHTNPEDFTKKAPCTIDEGDCYGCARNWRQSVMMYLNVLVEDGSKDPYVAVLSKGTGKNSLGKALLDIAADEDFNNSITDKVFKLSRSGTKKDTTYSLTALPKPNDKNVEDYEVYDLEKVVFKVNPENQEKYYTGAEAGSAKEEPAAAASATSVDVDW